MSITVALLLGVVMGFVFGIALERSKVIDPEVIIGQFQLKIFIMLKVFLTAIATSLCVYAFFAYLGYDRLSWKVFSIGPDCVGGVLLGIGVALAGACPGTVFAQIGSGYKDALATLLGAVVGALLFAAFKPKIFALIPWAWPGEKTTLDHVLGLPMWQVSLGLVACIVVALWLLERAFPWKSELKSL